MKSKKLSKSPVAYGVVATILAATSYPAYSWNIVCALHMAEFMQSSNLEKWDADSHAIRGMGFYYLAVSDLQRLQLEDSGNVVNPTVIEGSELATERAANYLSESSEQYATALELAEKHGLGDEKGLSLLSSLYENTTYLYDKLSSGELPHIEEFHDTTSAVMEYTQHGVDLSREHLEMGISGHGEGGSQYKIE